MEARRRALGINAEMTRPSTREYIPHIDGLRTLAVLSVFLFHLDVPGIEGGYLGVDVFFVISGYLITQIIKEASEQRRLSFTNFYARRIRRLFPALFVVMVMSTIAGVFVLSPERLIELAHSGIAAVLSVSNFYFLSQSGYFDAASDTQKPLCYFKDEEAADHDKRNKTTLKVAYPFLGEKKNAGERGDNNSRPDTASQSKYPGEICDAFNELKITSNHIFIRKQACLLARFHRAIPTV